MNVVFIFVQQYMLKEEVLETRLYYSEYTIGIVYEYIIMPVLNNIVSVKRKEHENHIILVLNLFYFAKKIGNLLV